MKQQYGPEFPMSKNPMIRLVRNNFKSHQLDIFQDRMIDAIEKGLNKDIPFKQGENSATVEVNTFTQRVIARISAQVFAGEAYADNEPLIDALASYSLTDFIIRRYIVVGKNIDVTMREVTPYLTELKKQEDQFGQTNPTNFMHMMLHTPAADDNFQTPEETAFWMKDIAFASIHTTSIFIGFALHDLSDRPDIQDLRRQEINETKEKYGELRPEIVAQMPITDSFLRESLRLGSNYVGFRHKAMKDTVLESGITIPKGFTNCKILVQGIPLTEFDPLRFVGRRSKKSTSVGPDLLVFGVGFYSCPGRYFASQEIRYILACILQNYDISTTTKDSKRAPNPLALGMIKLVPTQPIRFTKRA
ncbi:cytochrome P450 [Umbelopsis sp. PMI_123]|nr:cytochrome P450 [Umbelopsis sp. PMI_123]